MPLPPGQGFQHDLLTYAEKLQYEGCLRREETKEIVRRKGHSRKLVCQVIRGQRTDIFRVRQSSLEAWLPFLDGQWISGCDNASELWRRLKTKGFRGRLGVLSSASGHGGVGAPNRPPISSSTRCRPPEPLHG